VVGCWVWDEGVGGGEDPGFEDLEVGQIGMVRAEVVDEVVWVGLEAAEAPVGV
jgi:hypothetical protein